MTGPVKRLTLESGLDRLEQWSVEAGKTEQNLVYEALFSVVEGTVSWAYATVVDPDGDGFSVHVRHDIVLRIRLTGDGGFAVVSVRAQDRAGSPAAGHDADPDRQG